MNEERVQLVERLVKAAAELKDEHARKRAEDAIASMYWQMARHENWDQQ